MSRRITIVALAATATLIATQAAAERECLEDSCRIQEAAEPQASPQSEDLRVRREPEVTSSQYAERPQPPVVATTSVRPVRTAPPAAVRVERAPAVVSVPVPNYAMPQRPVVIDVARQRPSTASAAVIEVPGEIQTSDGLVTVYPNLRHDPAWKLCQIDSRDLGRRSYRCTAYSYHPYGEGGYRPYGTYKSYPTTPGYVLAPNAKIIVIEPND
jgi:hypothetical protein